MLRAADVLADLVRAARDGTAVDEARCKTLADELRALDPNGGRAEEEDDLSTLNFQPVLVRFEGLDDDAMTRAGRCGGAGCRAAAGARLYNIRFRPKPGLYAKANETALLLRELARPRRDHGHLRCVRSAAARASSIRKAPISPGQIELLTDQDEAAIREVFEFVDWDCDLEIKTPTIRAEGMDARRD